LRCYRQPGAMRAGFNYYRATPQDVKDNQAFLAQGKLPMPILCYGGAKGRERGALARESWQRVAADVRGGVAEDCGHWIAEEKPEWAVQEILKFLGEEA
jgi:pimeloyl-ACP methyl ester carboxylesterase